MIPFIALAVAGAFGAYGFTVAIIHIIGRALERATSGRA